VQLGAGEAYKFVPVGATAPGSMAVLSPTGQVLAQGTGEQLSFTTTTAGRFLIRLTAAGFGWQTVQVDPVTLTPHDVIQISRDLTFTMGPSGDAWLSAIR
jgi:hypothetical protein